MWTYEQAKEWLKDWGALCRKHNASIGTYNDCEQFVYVEKEPLKGGPIALY